MPEPAEDVAAGEPYTYDEVAEAFQRHYQRLHGGHFSFAPYVLGLDPKRLPQVDGLVGYEERRTCNRWECGADERASLVRCSHCGASLSHVTFRRGWIEVPARYEHPVGLSPEERAERASWFLIAEIGADGAEYVDRTAERAVAEIRRLRAELAKLT